MRLDDPFLHWPLACTDTSPHASRVGVVSKPQACITENPRFLALVISYFQQFEAYRNQFFADIYRFVVLTALTDAQNLRSGNFCDHDDRQTKPIALPLVRAGGVTIEARDLNHSSLGQPPLLT